MKRALWIVVLAFVPGSCGGAQEKVEGAGQVAVLCPEGSVFDPARNFCVAQALLAPPPIAAAPAPRDAGAVSQSGPVAIVPLAAIDAGSAVAVVADAGAAVAPPPGSLSVSVTCSFAKGWVSVLPVAKYPKDDSFLMQALIGFTQDPRFWNAEAEYAPLKPFAARVCGSSPVSIRVPAPGDYYVVVGQEGTFSVKGTYDKNGIRRKVTVGATGASYAFSSADLIFTWVCISCPWVRFEDAAGNVTASFVVLANRRDRALAGTDRIAVQHVPVTDGRVRLRLLEREDEVSHVDELVLELRLADGSALRLLPRRGKGRSALASRDGVTVELSRGTEVFVDYDVPEGSPDFVDLAVVATGYYDPL